MKIIKSNRTFKLYNSGFHWIIQCDDDEDSPAEFYKLVRACEANYGKETEWVTGEELTWGNYVWNTNWRFDVNKRLKRRRIYLKNETDVTLLMLKA